MSRQADFVRQPLLKKLNRQNFITRLERLEARTGPRPSARVGTLAEFTQATGELIVIGAIKIFDPADGELQLAIDPDGVWIENQQAGFGFEDTNGDRFNIYLLSDGTDNLVLKNQVGNIRMEIDLTDGSSANAIWSEDSALDNATFFRLGAGTAGVRFVGLVPDGETHFYIWGGRDGQETVFNESSYDIDFRIEGATVSDVFRVDAGEDRVELGSDHYFPTRNSSNPNGFWNEANQDMDFTFEGDNAAIVFKSDAGLDQAQLGAQVARTGVISPAQITANQHNYNPTGLSTASILRLTSDAERTLTGIAGGSTGRELTLYNIGSFNIILNDEDVNSTAGNRFALETAAVTIYPGYSVNLWYDSTSSRWRLSGDNPHGSDSVPLVDADNIFESTNVDTALLEIFKPVAFSAYRSTTQAITTGTNTVVIFDTPLYDSNSYYDETTGKFTPLIAGTYEFKYTAVMQAMLDTKSFWIGMRKNGGTIHWGSAVIVGAGGFAGSNMTEDFFMDGVDDYMEFIVWHDNGVNKNIFNGVANTRVSGRRISGADITGK